MEWFRKIRESIKPSKLPENVDDGLETLEEYNKRWVSVRVIYFTMFLMSLAFSIILTGVWPFLDKLDPKAGKEFMGLVVAANPLGQMIFSPLFGYWQNKSGTMRIPLLCSLTTFSVASAIYSSLELVPSHVKYWMLGSRFLIGVSSANIAVCRSYLSSATRLSERTGAVSMISLAQVLGFIVGPALQAAVTPLGSQGFRILWGSVILNMYTAAGWINVLMGIANIIMFMPNIFEERKVAAREIMIMQGRTSEKETWKAMKPDYVSAWTLIVAFFVLVFNFVLLETLGTSLTMDQFAWSKEQSLWYMGILLSVGAVIACVTFVAIKPLCKMFREEYVLIWGGFSLMVLGRVLYIPWGSGPPKIAEVFNITIPLGAHGLNNSIYDNPDSEIYLGCPKTQEWCVDTPALTLNQFIIGFAFTSIGYPIGVTLIQTIFSKILGPRPQGVWMGMMTGAGCLSRVLGPICVGSIYTRFGTYWTFGMTGTMMMISMVWLLLFKQRLIPPEVEKHAPVEMQPLNVVLLENGQKDSTLETNSNNEVLNQESKDGEILLPNSKSVTIVPKT
ncbi:major facilitator superfamily domain-containing protein 8 isoform X1 [Episyrphus balteatus]|uniref:major facilitator superfamily domain-containing protein 8 isoform X1 n=2 Tax=Episyrphus balteatus TaxID=286459 RepID=UPI002485302E|nr:major facilitator superfamily domain-containing protein 8 isoform X1 [Episyrphus balteatus]XP_055855342.1 major facilitator superfamily domain-containing protein 8 isoform X1 [Episyrphus balteatus]XP_055855343.1 major facilitator superfamily domain-containing protein 8 isoform X1 [Episyrphus balteatus]XP_055855344.1 major facilitator superfamily domain-containing protein 8 isoform X1 [Episyrphus balteatus]